MTRRRVLTVLLAGVLAAAALAGGWQAATTPGRQTLEARTQAIAATLRCPTCQNLSVADSPSDIAQSMREIIAEQLEAGRSPEEVRGWFVDRYGPWILLYPPREGISWLAWLAPVAILLGAAVAARRAVRDRAPTALDARARERAEAAYRRYRNGSDLDPSHTPAGERLAVALQVLASVRAGEADTPSEDAERIALGHVAAALDAHESEQATGGASSGSRPAAAGSWRSPARRRLAGRSAAAGMFVLAVVVLLPASLGPRGVGDVPTGGVAGRSDPAVPRGADEPPDGEDEARLQGFRDAVADDPNDPDARLRLAGELLRAGLAEEAADHYRAALNARPADATVRLRLALVLLQLDDAVGAERHASRVLDDQPDHPEALLVAGLAQTASGDPDGRGALRRFLDVAPPDHPGLPMARAVLDPQDENP